MHAQQPSYHHSAKSLDTTDTTNPDVNAEMGKA